MIQTPEQQFYISKLMGFQYEILYRSGRNNQVADALSRQEEMSLFCALSVVQNPIIAIIREANSEVQELQ